jgi:hypothetical protein
VDGRVGIRSPTRQQVTQRTKEHLHWAPRARGLRDRDAVRSAQHRDALPVVRAPSLALAIGAPVDAALRRR